MNKKNNLWLLVWGIWDYRCCWNNLWDNLIIQDSNKPRFRYVIQSKKKNKITCLGGGVVGGGGAIPKWMASTMTLDSL